MKESLKSRIEIKKDGKKQTVSKLEATLLRLEEKALSGDIRAIKKYLGLAEKFNNDELAASPNLSTNDKAILETYRQRVLSGAAKTPSPAKQESAPKRKSVAEPEDAAAHEKNAASDADIEAAWTRSGTGDAPATSQEEDNSWLN